MQISKRQVLDLVKVIAHYLLLTEQTTPASFASSFVVHPVTRLVDSNELRSLKDLLEGFLLREDEDDEKIETKGQGADAETIEAQPCSEDQEGRSSTTSSRDCGEEEPEIDGTIFNSDLNVLTLLQARIKSSSLGEPDDKVTLEFEDADFDRVDLLINGSDRLEEVGYVKRNGNELHVAECLDGGNKHAWHVFGVNKFPKDWLQLMGAGCLYRVIDSRDRD